jgi:hypothetical protein
MRAMMSAIALAALPLMCPTFESFTKCRIDDADPVFGQAVKNIEISSPDRCPYKIGVSRTAWQTFAGRITGDGAKIKQNTAVTSDVFIGLTSNPATEFRLHFFAGVPPQVQPSSDYLAGQGSGCCTPAGQDTGRLMITLTDGSTTVGVSDLTFTYEVYPSIRTGSTVPPGSVLIESSVMNARAPVTYKWYQDNGLLPQTSASFTKTLLEGSYIFKVIARDADGDTGYVSKTINVTNSSGGSTCGSTCPK